MTETETQPEADGPAPAELLINPLIPMFLAYSGDNVDLARKAAARAVNSYRFHSHGELISVVQVIAFGMATVGALSLSMAQDVPLDLIARFQTNAVALNKSEQRQRDVLRQAPPEQRREQRRPEPPRPEQPRPEPQPQPVAAPAAEAAQTQPAEAAPTQPAKPAQTQRQPDPAPLPVMGKADAKAFAALNAFIQGSTDKIPNPPFMGPRPVGIRAAALNSVAQHLLTPAQAGVAISRRDG